MTLAQAAVGRPVKVRQVVGTGEVSLRLMEMGVTPGVEITLRGAAPLGDPLEFELRGYRLSLRKAEAALVEVSE
jgi:ferrous iron transport protein A